MNAQVSGSTGRVSGDTPFNGVQIFSAMMAQERETLGEKVTDWISRHPELEIVDTVVTQSSDDAFHCLAITLFFKEQR